MSSTPLRRRAGGSRHGWPDALHRLCQRDRQHATRRRGRTSSSCSPTTSPGTCVQYMPHVQQMQRAGHDVLELLRDRLAVLPVARVDLHRPVPARHRVFTNGGRRRRLRRVQRARRGAATRSRPRLQRAGYRDRVDGQVPQRLQARRARRRRAPYVPPGWNEWDVAGNGYPEFNYNLNENGTDRPLRRHAGGLPDRRARATRAPRSSTGRRGRASRSCSRSRRSRRTRPYTPGAARRARFPGLQAPRDAGLRRAPTSTTSRRGCAATRR